MRRAYLRLEGAVLVLVVSVVMILTGCGTSTAIHPAAAVRPSATFTPSPSASPTPAPGPAAFVASVAAVGLGNDDVDGTQAGRHLLKVGAALCQVLEHGGGYEDVINVTSDSIKSATVSQVQNLVDSAITNLCPDQSSEIPGGQ